jgi:GT2 family glycosyltransferase
VIIPTWNGAHLLAPCLAALARQAAWPDFETIVVDNGSRDATPEVLAAHPWARVLRLPRNVGFAAAVNAGLQVAQSDVLVLLNNDTEPEARWLGALVGALRSSAAGMATSKVLVHGRPGPVLHTTGDTVDLRGWPANRGVWQVDHGQFDAQRAVFAPNGAAGAYRRDVFDDVGAFATEFESYLEDVDLGWRARAAGWDCIFVPDAVVYHHVSATGGGATASYLVARNRVWLIVRNYPGRLLRRHIAAVAGAQLAEAGRALRALRGSEARATLRGLVAGWLTWPKMLPARSRIAARRRIDDRAMERLLRMGEEQHAEHEPAFQTPAVGDRPVAS